MANVIAGNGTLTSLAELTAPGTIGGSGAVTFPGGIVIVGTITGATTIAASSTITASGASPQLTISNTTGSGINSAQAAANSFTINTTTTSTNTTAMFKVSNNGSAVLSVGSAGNTLLAGALAITGALSGATTINTIPLAVQGSPSTTPGFYCGVGVPTLSAANGSIYVRFDGATGGSMWYANTSGASTVGTTWTAQAAP